MADKFLADMAAADDELLAALGETVTVKDTLGAAAGSVVGVFEERYVEINDVQGFKPTFLYKESDLTIEDGYEITYQARAFNVRFPQPDGTGMSLLILGKK